MKYDDFTESEPDRVTGNVTEIVAYIFVAVVLWGLFVKIIFF